MDKKEKKSLPEPRTYTVEQIAAMLNIGRTTAYQLVKQEEFRNAIGSKNLWRFFIPIFEGGWQ